MMKPTSMWTPPRMKCTRISDEIQLGFCVGASAGSWIRWMVYQNLDETTTSTSTSTSTYILLLLLLLLLSPPTSSSGTNFHFLVVLYSGNSTGCVFQGTNTMGFHKDGGKFTHIYSKEIYAYPPLVLLDLNCSHGKQNKTNQTNKQILKEFCSIENHSSLAQELHDFEEIQASFDQFRARQTEVQFSVEHQQGNHPFWPIKIGSLK